MISNSKLTPDQKRNRKLMLRKLPKGSTIANDGLCLTVLCVPDGSVTRVFSSVCSDTERKVRRKVGEFYAVASYVSWNAGMILPGFETADQVVRSLCGVSGVTTFSKD